MVFEVVYENESGMCKLACLNKAKASQRGLPGRAEA
jgi:hypothetical protein